MALALRSSTDSLPDVVAEAPAEYDCSQAPDDVRKLVCQSCWDDLFSTPAFWHLCNFGNIEDGPVWSGPSAEHIISSSHLKENANDCNWRSVIRSVIDPDTNDSYDVTFYVSLQRSTEAGSYTQGKNDWIVTVYEQGAESAQCTTFGAFTNAEDISAHCVTARPLVVDVDTEEAVGQIRSWIKACELHDQCPEQKKQQLPTRLIDVGHGRNLRPRVVEMRGQTGHYAALSYCWGGPQMGALRGDVLGQYTTTLPMNQISQTIKDAIKVVRAVGLRYLWVDAFCIIQDDDKDKIREISCMHEIYRNALFTTASESASSASEGFLAPRKQAQPASKVPFRCPDGNFGSMSLHDTFYDPHETYPLERRGWACQESLLSPRLLSYNPQTLKWSCQGHEYNLGSSLCNVTHENDLLPSGAQQSHESIHESWLSLLHDYTLRDLTDPADRLVALGGVAKALVHVRKSRYLAGMWEANLIPDLLWRCSEKTARKAGYRAPSWSWASADGLITNFTRGSEEPISKVMECEVVPASPEALYGPVMNGWLVIEAPLLQGRFRILPERPLTYEVRWEDEIFNPRSGEFSLVTWNIDLDVVDEEVDETEMVLSFLFLIAEFEPGTLPAPYSQKMGLILQRLNDGDFLRIGVFGHVGIHDHADGLPEPGLKYVRRVKVL